jgi:myo-inositol-1(or 4)-monophosphatase
VGPVLRMKNGVEPVTDFDLRSDRIIRGVLGRCFPRVPVLSEESDGVPVVGERPLWIVDPIDGTANFARGHRYVAVSIAFAIDGVVRVGVVHASGG